MPGRGSRRQPLTPKNRPWRLSRAPPRRDRNPPQTPSTGLLLSSPSSSSRSVTPLGCWLWPFGACRRCNGTGKRRSPFGRAFGLCRRCDGDGRRLRIGRRDHQRPARAARQGQPMKARTMARFTAGRDATHRLVHPRSPLQPRRAPLARPDRRRPRRPGRHHPRPRRRRRVRRDPRPDPVAQHRNRRPLATRHHAAAHARTAAPGRRPARRHSARPTSGPPIERTRRG